MEEFVKFLPLVIPLAAIQFGFVIFCVVDILKKKATKNLSPAVWIVITVALMNTFIGPILYIIFGRAETSDNG
ncbi:MAG: PLDc N-terminal domain-containing protein [Oscillospiraceae bacterium]|nr:PLDc N-terminal domain-containing protein [Oscillospiraceae bacterium]